MKQLNYTKISSYAAWGFIILLVLLHFLKSEVDPSWQPISEYALGNWGWLMNIAFLFLGISMLFLGSTVYNKIKSVGGRIGGILLILASVGNFLAVFFNTDPAGTLPEEMTTSGKIHSGSAGLLGLMILATIVVLWQFYKQSELRQYRTHMLIMTIIVWVFELVMISSMGMYLSQTNGLISPDTPIGWQGRMVIIACAAWLIICAKRIELGFRKA
jgi:hypothetical protein